MHKIIEVAPDAKHLLSLFAKDSSLNCLRYQQYLRIYIPYAEYVAFVKFCIKNNITVLYFDLELYSMNLHIEQKLSRLYLMDISEIVLYELSLSCRMHRECLDIRHSFEDVQKIVALDSCLELFNGLDEDCRRLCLKTMSNYMQQFGNLEGLPQELQRIFCYGLYLRAISLKKDATKFNIGG